MPLVSKGRMPKQPPPHSPQRRCQAQAGSFDRAHTAASLFRTSNCISWGALCSSSRNLRQARGQYSTARRQTEALRRNWLRARYGVRGAAGQSRQTEGPEQCTSEHARESTKHSASHPRQGAQCYFYCRYIIIKFSPFWFSLCV